MDAAGTSTAPACKTIKVIKVVVLAKEYPGRNLSPEELIQLEYAIFSEITGGTPARSSLEIKKISLDVFTTDQDMYLLTASTMRCWRSR